MFHDLIAWFKGLFSKAQPTATPTVTPVVPPVSPIPVVPVDNFPFALNWVLLAEGGFSNRPDDTPTNYGITMATLALWRGIGVTVEDVRLLTVTEVSLIYRSKYWYEIGLSNVQSQPISAAIFDQGVVSGPETSIKYAQLASNNCGASLMVDGVIGPNTVAALKQVDVAAFLRAFHALLKDHYDEIVKNNPAKQVFYNGWMNRADRLLTLG